MLSGQGDGSLFQLNLSTDGSMEVMPMTKDILNDDPFKEDLTEYLDLVQEYYRRNELKKTNEKWLKDNREKILEVMRKIGKDKADIGDYRVSITIPDTSGFDKEKVLQFLEKRGLLDETTDRVPNEEKIQEAIAQGLFTLEDLKEAAWVTATGSPRINIIKRSNQDENM